MIPKTLQVINSLFLNCLLDPFNDNLTVKSDKMTANNRKKGNRRNKIDIVRIVTEAIKAILLHDLLIQTLKATVDIVPIIT